MKATCVGAIWLVAVVGCELGYDPDNGRLHAVLPDSHLDDGESTVAVCGDTDPSTSVSLERDLRPLFSRSPGGCDCHDSRATSGFSLGSYERLLSGGTTARERIIIPGNPCDSVLVQKLSPFPPFGARMPFSSGGSTYFNATDRRLIADWIAEGALNN